MFTKNHYIETNYEPNMEALKSIKQILMDIQGEIDSSTVIVQDLTPIDINGWIFQMENQQGNRGFK